jgi:hypothetical protein
MTAFASVALTTRLEDTPAACPYYAGTGDRTCKSGCWQEPSCITDEPSGGWESQVFIQHNEPNPILVAMRRSAADAQEWHVAVFSTEIYGGHRAWEDEGHRFHVLTSVRDEHLDHAERVLDRYLRIREVSS